MHAKKSLILALGIAAALPLFADSKADPINKDGSGVAIKGYDPVAYFTQSKPVKGSSTFSYQWMNSTWWFASAQARDAIVLNPATHVRQYGCCGPARVRHGQVAPVHQE